MNEKDLKKGISELKNIRMTDEEKARMLKAVLSSSVESPYMKRVPAFAFIYSHHGRVILATCLVALISLGTVAYASEASLPGDVLYPIKTRVVESVLDIVNSAPERKIVWEEKKITRRILEAEMLAEKDELDDEKLEELGRSIEKSSAAFAEAVSIVASSTNLRQEFRRKINERKEVFDDEEKKQEEDNVTNISDVQSGNAKKESSSEKHANQREKIQRLKDAVIKVLDDKDKEDNHSGSGEDENQESKGELNDKIETEIKIGF